VSANNVPIQPDFRTKARVLLSIKSQLLNDLLRSLLSVEPTVEIAGEVLDPAALLIAIRQTSADVVIQSWPSDQMPEVCSHLLAAYPDLTVIGLSADGEFNFTCHRPIVVDQPSEPGLSGVQAAIRQAVAEFMAPAFAEQVTEPQAVGT
jgi:hypothetical protein